MTEPVVALRTAVRSRFHLVLSLCVVFSFCSTWAQAQGLNSFLSAGIPAVSGANQNLIEKAVEALKGDSLNAFSFAAANPDDDATFEPSAVAGKELQSVRFIQKFRGIEVLGENAAVHFDASGNVHDISKHAVQGAGLSTIPALNSKQVEQLVSDRYQAAVQLSAPLVLKVFRDFNGTVHLVYHVFTASTPEVDGKELVVDAHSGAIILEMDRTFDAVAPKYVSHRTVYRADTDLAHKYVEPAPNMPGSFYPTVIHAKLYNKVLEDGRKVGDVDGASARAYKNAGAVYNYYASTFGRKSYDGQDSRLRSIVHGGINMANAFWSQEYQVMVYGDGDGKVLKDLTLALDVAAHEFTHGVVATTANLVYAGEPGALNESYADFFGKMVAHVQNDDWNIGAAVAGPDRKGGAIRNMMYPERFGQPGSTGSLFKIRTDGACTKDNDRCGVHRNSGIPNRAAALIVTALGKSKAEKLYFNVLTARLQPTSTFHDARVETEQECNRLFGSNGDECDAVAKAFDEVGM